MQTAIYSFTTHSGSVYRVDRMSHTGSLSLWKQTPEGTWDLQIHSLVEAPLISPWEGDRAVFVGTHPSGREHFRITTSPVVSVELPRLTLT